MAFIDSTKGDLTVISIRSAHGVGAIRPRIVQGGARGDLRNGDRQSDGSNGRFDAAINTVLHVDHGIASVKRKAADGKLFRGEGIGNAAKIHDAYKHLIVRHGSDFAKALFPK